MIRKPKRVNVRFSDVEFAELENLIKMANAWDMTTLIRRAVAFYRLELYRRQEQLLSTGHAASIVHPPIGEKIDKRHLDLSDRPGRAQVGQTKGPKRKAVHA